jgi:hypothetical protein
MFKRLLLIGLTIAFALPCSAEVIRIEVTSRGDLLSGKYEKLSGKIYFAVDPRNSANQIITDIDKAPKNASGKIEFSSDFYMIKPKDMSRSNGTILYEVSNRGNKGMIGHFNRTASVLDPKTDADLGDAFLMNQGFTLLWVGWQFDTATNREGLLHTYVPKAREADGRSIQGLVRADFEPREKVLEASLVDRGNAEYPVVDPKDAANVMTVRDSVEGVRRVVPRDQWEFAADGTSVKMAAGFEPHKIYEVVYKSQDPAIAGLGLAAMRDSISKLKYTAAPELGLTQGSLRRAIGFGISQSGRLLRTYLYYGFNEDESHRKVFDGIFSHVAGAGRGSFNQRFAQPSRTADPFANFFYTVDVFPFTDVEQLDPETGRRDGLLTHHMKAEFMPKVMYTNSSHEYWGRAASLFTTTIDGKEDAAMMANVRAYLYTGGTHGNPAAFPPTRTNGQLLNNPMDYRWAARKLLVALNTWITAGTEPPPSAVPRVSNATFTTPDKLKFPKLPNLTAPTSSNIHKAYRADYGPEFVSKGIITQEPPKIKSAFTTLVPQIDADGNDLAGIRMPEVAVPLATFVGWNFYNERSGPTTELVTDTGAMIPFARTRAEREQANDPRPSIEERYKSREQYLELITKSANELAAKGYLIKEDIPRIVEQAGTRWDWALGNSH